MKKSLQFVSGFVILCISVITLPASGQTIILTENFSGFSAGSHTTPSTSDASPTLDSKTSVSGWTGSLIYPAGGEIKIGTSSVTGWIETPAIDLSGNGGSFMVSFDICRWPSDASTVQVYLNGIPVGNVITPGDLPQQVQITGTGGDGSSKIKISGLTKRFYLDNLIISSGVFTHTGETFNQEETVKIYPVPAFDVINVNYTLNIDFIDITDLSGKVVYKQEADAPGELNINIAALSQGIYFIRFWSARGILVRKFIKS